MLLKASHHRIKKEQLPPAQGKQISLQRAFGLLYGRAITLSIPKRKTNKQKNKKTTTTTTNETRKHHITLEQDSSGTGKLK